MTIINEKFETLKELSSEYISELGDKNLRNGIKTGFTDIDYFTRGLQSGSVIILAARPCMGKTIMSLNMAENIAIKQKNPVAFFSLNEGRKYSVQSIFSSLTNIERYKFRTVQFSSDEISLIQASAKDIADSPLFFSSSLSYTLTSICDDIETLHQKVGLKVVILDSLQLIQHTCTSKICSTLKLLAIKLDIAIIVLSDLSRDLEKRANKRPVFSDLLKGDEIVKYASLIIFIYRDKLYNPDSQGGDATEIIIAKNDYGPTGVSIELPFDGK